MRTLVELVAVLDSCSFSMDRDDSDQDYGLVTKNLYEALGKRVAVLVCDCCSLREKHDPLHRIFLPTTEEEWHLEASALGQENLCFLGRAEAVQLQSNVRKMNEFWNMMQNDDRPPPVPPGELPGEVFDAACKGDEAAVEAWLDGGGHVDARMLEEDGAGGTLLLASACNGSLRMVELLLSRGASPDIQNALGCTALMGAAFEGDVAVVRRLLQSGAASDLQNNNGNTVLTIARQRHHTEIVALLGEFGVNTEDGLSGMMGLFAQLQAQFPDSVAAIHLQ